MSEGNSTIVIAEAGVNHNGDLSMARELIDVAAAAGADFVKFQTFSADRLVTAAARKAAYQSRNTGRDDSQYEMLRALELTDDMHRSLIEHTKGAGIRFLSTAFDIESLDLLLAFGVALIKISVR